jgi:pimeloyl-ACP methyl ester carboxylesterase
MSQGREDFFNGLVALDSSATVGHPCASLTRSPRRHGRAASADKLSPPANADKLNAAISGSRKVLIDKAGHYPFIEHQDQFNAAVREFLKPQS